ncbi:MAG TPA: hemolysin III family protein [Petrimonas sp.]|uniref:PAQR family membrane homeostasis protein TrhA n=1 Tax=Petrimonas sp. TaxID=2023866 RepID=UPI0017630F44|nr:hemolysin III family protein [Petrimonas sp.]
MNNNKFYTPREEKANYLTHAAGVLMAVIATVLLLRKAILADNGWAILAYTIFGFGMLACMLSSTVYHFVQEPGRKARLRHFDHASIYLLIAASYSPFTLVLLREKSFWGWSLFGLVWIIAFIGITVSFGELKKNSHLKTASYVLMGLVVLIAFKPLIETANEKNCIEVILWLIAGGVFYITGAIVYATAKREFVHAVFHIFVLFGLASHIIGAYIIPLN